MWGWGRSNDDEAEVDELAEELDVDEKTLKQIRESATGMLDIQLRIYRAAAEREALEAERRRR